MIKFVFCTGLLLQRDYLGEQERRGAAAIDPAADMISWHSRYVEISRKLFGSGLYCVYLKHIKICKGIHLMYYIAWKTRYTMYVNN